MIAESCLSPFMVIAGINYFTMTRCKSVIKAAFASSSNYMSYWGGVHAMNLFVNILHAMSMMGKNITDGSSPLGFLLGNSFGRVFCVYA